MPSVDLADGELVLLDGRCSPGVQTAVDGARARLEAVASYPELPEALAGFVADVVEEARREGLLVYRRARLRTCALCKRNDGYVPYKSGPSRGRANWNKPRLLEGVELARRFVSVENHVTLGGCVECVTRVVELLRLHLAHVPAEVPEQLRHEEAPARKRWTLVHCTACGWDGHEGLMGRRPVLMGGGDYPAECPSCDAVNLALGRTVIERVEGHVVVELAAQAGVEG